jgi:hypothetical protein
MREAAELFWHLAKTPRSDEALAKFLLQLPPKLRRPATAAATPVVRKAWETRAETIAASRVSIQRARAHGIEERAIPLTETNSWEALISVTACVDHQQETVGDRYAHVLLGTGDKLKTSAVPSLSPYRQRH